MQSRMQQRLRQLDALNTTKRESDAVTAQMNAADNDVFELAARVALGAWAARPASSGADEFAIGYRTAAAELALILRSMRKQTPPEQFEVAAIEAAIREEYTAE